MQCSSGLGTHLIGQQQRQPRARLRHSQAGAGGGRPCTPLGHLTIEPIIPCLLNKQAGSLRPSHGFVLAAHPFATSVRWATKAGELGFSHLRANARSFHIATPAPAALLELHAAHPCAWCPCCHWRRRGRGQRHRLRGISSGRAACTAGQQHARPPPVRGGLAGGPARLGAPLPRRLGAAASSVPRGHPRQRPRGWSPLHLPPMRRLGRRGSRESGGSRGGSRGGGATRGGRGCTARRDSRGAACSAAWMLGRGCAGRAQSAAL